MLKGAGTWRVGQGLAAFLPTCLLGLLPLLVLLSGPDPAVALPTRSPPTGLPLGLRGGEPVARTEAYVRGDQGGTRPPETQVITQQVLEARGEPLEQTLPQVTRGYTAAEAGDAVTVEGLPVVGQNNTEAGGGDEAGPPGKDTGAPRNTSAARKNDNGQAIVEMEESMEKIKSTLKQLEVDIERKRKTDEGKELSPAAELLTNLTAVRPDHQEGSSAKVWHKSGGPAGMSSGSHQMLPAIKPGSGDYSQNITDKQINTTEEIDEAGADGTNSSSSEDELLGTEATTQTVWKWNIQNGTNYTEPLDDLRAAGVPLGKVCILLNGTVVKDMEELDCKSQAGLHYKYVPSRLRKNGTNVNSTAAYTSSPEGGDIEEEEGFEPQEQGANWEDAQWELYNGNLERNPTLGESSSLDNNTEGTQLLGRNPLLGGQLLNISETSSNPFESPLNGTGPLHTSPGISHADQAPNVVPGPEGGRKPLREGIQIDPLLTENHTNQTNNTETTSQIFWAENKGSVLNNSSRSGNASSSRNQTASPQPSMGTQLHGVANYSQAPGGILSDVHINGSQPLKDGRNSSPWELVKEKAAGGSTPGNSSGLSFLPPTGGQRTENASAIKDAGKELADNKPDRIEPNPKFMREPTLTTRKPHPVHVFRNRYPPHAIQGLIWEDRRYMVSVLVPVACGMAGAFLIVCLAYLSRHCRYQQPKLKQLPNVPKEQLTQFDRVMLLADSSDEDF